MASARNILVASLSAGAALLLLHCGGDPKASDEGIGGGGAASGGTSSSGGKTSSGGDSSGGSDSSGGTSPGGNSSEGGAGGSGGMGGSCDSEPSKTHCCESEDPSCDTEDWELVCYNDWNEEHFCCDEAVGARRSCSYDGDFYTYSDALCLRCDDTSYGTGACDACFGELGECTPSSGPFGETPCSGNEGECKVSDGGYALDCGIKGIEVLCTCDPNAR